MSIKILLADDHNVVREGFWTLLDAHHDMEVTGEAANGRGAVALSRQIRPDVIIMDVSMPDLNGIEATREILAEFPQAKIIGLSIHAEGRYIAEMLKAGASGYLLKDCPSSELISAIRTVVAGHTHLSPSVTDKVVTDYVRTAGGPEATVYSQLTSRERQVLQLLAEGRTMKEIADTLHLSVQTVHSHRQRLMQKLACHTIADLTKYAIREGITEL